MGKKFTRLHFSKYLDMVVCTCHPAMQEAAIGQVTFPGQPCFCKKFHEITSQQKKLGMVWWCTPIISAVVDSIKWEAHNLVQPGQKAKSDCQKTLEKKDWKHGSGNTAPAWKAQGPKFNPSTTKNLKVTSVSVS
jgi:hypothetical protein